MPTVGSNDRPTSRLRRIGPIGTTARIVVGILLLGSVIQGHLAGPFHPAAWALGLLGFPALLLGWQWLRFYGASMLLAAVRGYAGCEVLAVSNWLLGRDDQIGCLLFWPVDHAERRRTHAGMPASR